MDSDYREVRGIKLLDGEEVRLTLDGRYGLLNGVPPQDDFIAVTNRRLICFARKDGKRRRVLLPIGSVEAVEVTELARSVRPLLSGGLLLLAAVGVSWTATVLGWGGILPWIIGAVLVALGALTASSYFVSEDSPSITFRARTTEVSLALRGEEALRDAYRLANGPFQAQGAPVGDSSVAEEASLVVEAPVAGEELEEAASPSQPSDGDSSAAEEVSPEGAVQMAAAEYVTVGEAAERIGVSQSRIRELIRLGRIEGAVRVGRRWMIPSSFRVTPVKIGRPRKE